MSPPVSGFGPCASQGPRRSPGSGSGFRGHGVSTAGSLRAPCTQPALWACGSAGWCAALSPGSRALGWCPDVCARRHLLMEVDTYLGRGRRLVDGACSSSNSWPLPCGLGSPAAQLCRGTCPGGWPVPSCFLAGGAEERAGCCCERGTTEAGEPSLFQAGHGSLLSPGTARCRGGQGAVRGAAVTSGVTSVPFQGAAALLLSAAPRRCEAEPRGVRRQQHRGGGACRAPWGGGLCALSPLIKRLLCFLQRETLVISA